MVEEGVYGFVRIISSFVFLLLFSASKLCDDDDNGISSVMAVMERRGNVDYY